MFASDAARLFEAIGSPAVTGEAVDTFRRWVNCKVLPAIFATGGYILNPDCISSATVSDMDRMPLPAEAGVMVCALAQNPAPIRHSAADEDVAFERAWRSCLTAEAAQVAEAAPAYDGSFFRRVRSLGDHPAVRDLNAHIDAVVLPALFDHPGAIDRLPAILEAAEMDGGILDI